MQDQPWYDPFGHPGQRARLRREIPDIGDGVESWGPDWNDYVVGYQRAIERLMESVRANHDQDSLVYPIVWLGRHAIEVALKGLIIAFRNELEMKQEFGRTHDLVKLRKLAEHLLRQLGASDEDQLARLSDSIGRIAALDPESTRFRYPEALDGTPSTDMGAINLDVFAEEVESILNEISAERMRVEDEGEDRRELAYHEAYEEFLSGLTDEERDEYIAEEEYLWHRWMERD